MANTHNIYCDQCNHLMNFSHEVSLRGRAYTCSICTDRWALVRLDSTRAVASIRHVPGREITKEGVTHTILNRLFGRRKSS